MKAIIISEQTIDLLCEQAARRIAAALKGHALDTEGKDVQERGEDLNPERFASYHLTRLRDDLKSG